MMITIRKALIFATLAISGSAAHGDNKKETNERGAHLRGKTQQQQSQPERNLALRSAHHIAHVGECPNWPQATGIACYQYIPMGATATTCFYGQMQCDCDTAIGISWMCRPIQNQVVNVNLNNVKVPPAPVPPPTQPPVQPSPPTPRPTMAINIHQSNVHVHNTDPNCPATKPAHESYCPPRNHDYLSCTYWDDSVSKFIQCDCTKADVFLCRPSNNPSLVNLSSP